MPRAQDTQTQVTHVLLRCIIAALVVIAKEISRAHIKLLRCRTSLILLALRRHRQYLHATWHTHTHTHTCGNASASVSPAHWVSFSADGELPALMRRSRKKEASFTGRRANTAAFLATLAPRQ